MPPAIIGAVVAGAVGAAATFVGGAIAAGSIAGAIEAASFFGATGWAAIGLSFAVGFAGSLLTSAASSLIGQQSAAREIPFAAEASGRTQMVRSSIASRKVVVGESVVSGALVFAASYGTANGQPPPPGTLNRDYLALVVVLAAHEVAEVAEVWLNDTLATDVRFAGLVTINRHLGAADQEADADLIAAGVGWTSEHRGRGLAYITVLLKWDADAFPTGIPNVKARVRGLEVYDPRDGVTAWSDNVALIARHYKLNGDYGLSSAADEIDEATYIAAANICDEDMAVPDASDTVTADPAADTLTLPDEDLDLRTGDRVRIASTGTLPAGLAAATDYWAIRIAPTTIKLAASLAAARRFVAIDLTDAGSGTHTLTRKGQPRYTANGVIDTAAAPGAILDRLMSAAAAITVWQQGQHRLFVGAATSATFDLDESDLRGPIQVLPRQAKRDLANAIRGTFIDPAKAWQPADFPAQTNAFYEAQDGGEQIWRDIELSFTTDSIRAQRLAKIVLEAMRQGAALKWPSKASALKIAVGDVGTVTVSALGYAGKQFRCTGWSLAEDGGIDLELREYAAAVFDWAGGDATLADPAPDTTLPNAYGTATVAITGFAETLIETRAGAGVAARLTVSWSPAADAFVAGYDLEYRPVAETAWTPRPRTGDTSLAIDDIAAGRYEFRLRMVNTLGVRGAWSDIATWEVLGLSARPADVTGLSLTALMGHGVLRWDRHPDLDVRIGGRIVVRWSPAAAGAAWADSTELPGLSIAGSASEATVPLLAGTYLVKASDSSGNLSAGTASVATTLPDMIGMNVVHLVDELAAGFPGTKSGTAAIGGVLQLDAAGTVDGIAAIDAVPSWDYEGGVASSGSYAFADTVDLGAVYTCRVAADLAVQVFNSLDTWDSRTASIDAWDSIDGAVADAVARAALDIRTTQDDPAGSPAWTAWAPFLVGNHVARGYQFRLRLETDDPAYNIRVTALAVSIDVPDSRLAGAAASSAVADTTVTFASRFWAAPSIGHTIQAGAAGDEFELVSKSATGFVFNVRNGGSRVVRTVDWQAAGYGLGG